MYLKIDEELYKKISDITNTDYEIEGEYLPVDADSIISIFEDLLAEIERKEDELEELKRDMEDNYKPISVSEQVDIDDSYFI